MALQKHTRRTFLRMSAFTAVGVALVACSRPETATPVQATTAPAEATAAPEATATTAEGGRVY